MVQNTVDMTLFIDLNILSLRFTKWVWQPTYLTENKKKTVWTEDLKESAAMDTVWWIWRRAFRKRIWCQDQDQEALDWEMLWSKDLDQETVVSFTDREVPAGAAQLRLSGHLGGLAGRWRGRWILEQSSRRHRLESRKEYFGDVKTFAKLVFLKPIGHSVNKWGRVRKRKTSDFDPTVISD